MADVFGDPLINFKLLEPVTGVLPSDAAGALEDMDAGTTNTRPVVLETEVTGFARVFDGAATGLEVADGSSLLRLTRSITVQFIIRFDIAAQDAIGNPGTVCALGFRDSSPGEDLQLLVELDSVNLVTRTANLRMRWEDVSGVLEVGNVGVDFVLPQNPAGADAAVLFTVVREWISDTEVIVRYYGNDLFLGSETSTDGDIGGEPGALFMLGVRGDGAGGYENYLDAELETIGLLEYVMTAEEIRQISRRLTVHAVDQYEALKSLLPKDVYSNDPESIVQREINGEGQMLAEVISKIFEIRDDFLPDRAWSFLDRWETVLGLIPRPSDTLTERRNRLLSFLRTIEGFSLPGVKLALEPTFDLLSADIEIVEFDHLLLDDFATALAVFWQSVPGGGTVTITAGELVIAHDLTTEPRWYLAGIGTGPAYVKTVIDGDAQAAETALDAEASVKITAHTFDAQDEIVGGLAFLDLAKNNMILVGTRDTGAGIELASILYENGVQGPLVSHGAEPALPYFLNLKFVGGTSYEIATAPGSDQNDLTAVATITGVATPGVVLVAVVGINAGGGLTNAVTFDDFRLHTPNGLRVFNWYAFRDTGLPGDPDIPGANAVVKRIKPAHTHAAAISDIALLFDSSGSLFDDGPLES